MENKQENKVNLKQESKNLTLKRSKKEETEVKNGKKNQKFSKWKRFKKPQSLYEQKVISISRITKVTKGGRQFRFAALVIVGDKKSQVGFGKGKAREVPIAIKKAITNAEKHLQKITIVNNTIPHEVHGKWCGSRILIKPAKKGKGLIAGGSVRIILELAGVKNIYSKIFGSHTKINVIRATFDALSKLKTYQDYQLLRFFDQIKKIKPEENLNIEVQDNLQLQTEEKAEIKNKKTISN